MIPLLGLIIGLVLGLVFNVSVPAAYASYVAVSILAILDAVIGGVYATQRARFSSTLFISGLLVNGLVALLLTALGEQLGVTLYLVPMFAFGYRIFLNLGRVRRLFLRRIRRARQIDFDEEDMLL